MNGKHISDILNMKTPVSTRKVISKLGVPKSKGKWLSPEESKIVRTLWKFWDQDLIEPIERLGWVLTEKGQKAKEKRLGK